MGVDPGDAEGGHTGWFSIPESVAVEGTLVLVVILLALEGGVLLCLGDSRGLCGEWDVDLGPGGGFLWVLFGGFGNIERVVISLAFVLVFFTFLDMDNVVLRKSDLREGRLKNFSPNCSTELSYNKRKHTNTPII